MKKGSSALRAYKWSVAIGQLPGKAEEKKRRGEEEKKIVAGCRRGRTYLIGEW
jgi:hypothetical protein